MWKDFFYFNKSQRIGIIVLLSLIALTLIGTWLLPRFVKPKEVDKEAQQAFLQEAAEFLAGIREKEKNNPRKSFSTFEQRNYNKREFAETKYTLFAFDPNAIDSAGFVALGLKPYVARNIIRYRQKGGKFKDAEAFGKIYGIDEDKLSELKPYITIAEQFQAKKVNRDSIPTEQKAEKPGYTSKAELTYAIELNAADTTELMQVKGIGSYYARNIIAYRKVLGGYYSVEQLREVRGMTDDNFERIKYALTADGTQIRKIDINRASIDFLKNHPYIGSFQRAKVIYDYRRKVGKLKEMDDLHVLDEFTRDEWQRLTPYFEFN